MATNTLLNTDELEKCYKGERKQINILARMLAGYDEPTWSRLKRDRKLTYIRAATTLYHKFEEFEKVINARL